MEYSKLQEEVIAAAKAKLSNVRETILDRCNIRMGDKVTNGKGNTFTVAAATEYREPVGCSSIQVSIRKESGEENHTFWIDEKHWHKGDWFKL